MNKNTIWAAVLSFLILFVWFYFFGERQKSNQNTAQNANLSNNIIKTESNIEISKINEMQQDISQENYEFVLENDKQKIVLDTNGKIKELFLKEKNDSTVNLVYSIEKNIPLMTNPSIIYDKNAEIIFSKDGLQKGIILNGKILDFENIFVKTIYEFIDNQFLLNVKFNFQNKTDNDIKISNFKIFLGEGIATNEKIPYKQKIKDMKFSYYSNEKFYSKKIKPGIYEVNNSWIAISNHYFISAIIDKNNFFKNIELLSNSLPMSSYLSDIILPANNEINLDFDVLFSDKDYKYLKSFNKKIEKTVSLGFFGGIGNLVLFLLFFLQHLTGNYGWAIIMLTVFLQFILMPLNIKSYKSMHALKKLQPKINDLKTKYSNDSQKMNMEMMMIYKKEGVNPFGGCLPMLLQIPIFFALFTALRNSAELRYSPFILWIKDLSRPDTVGNIAGISINILPILMCITMFFSQKLNSGIQNTTSATVEENSMNKAMLFMPIIFLFMFWSFPSGLVLYWLVSNIFTISLNSYLKFRLKE